MGMFSNLFRGIDSLIDMETQMATVSQHPDFTLGQ